MRHAHPALSALVASVLFFVAGFAPSVPAQAKPGDAPEADPKAAVTRHVSMLTDALAAKDERQAVEALTYLARYPKDSRVVPALGKALQRSGKVGEIAAGALGTVGGKKAAGVLASAIKKKATRKDTVRAIAILGALGEIGTREAIKPLLREIDARDDRIALAAVGSLPRVRVGRRQVIGRLISRLESVVSRRKTESDSRKIQALAARIGALTGAINQMTGQDFVHNPTLIRRWWKKNRKKVADKLPPPKRPSDERPPEKRGSAKG